MLPISVLAEWIFGYGNDIARSVLNKVNALALTNEHLRVIKVGPAVVLAFVHIYRWTTLPLVVWNVSRGRLSRGNDERVIDHNVLSRA